MFTVLGAEAGNMPGGFHRALWRGHQTCCGVSTCHVFLNCLTCSEAREAVQGQLRGREPRGKTEMPLVSR